MRTGRTLGLSRLALLLGLLAVAQPARGESLIFTLSTDRIRITSDFRGTSVVGFGAIERDAETVSRSSTYDIVIVMRGPPETLVTRRKERFAGIWINRASRTFSNLPAFYLASASRPLADISTASTLERYQIGTASLALTATGGPDNDGAFREALIRLKTDDGQFLDRTDGVSFPSATVFKADLPIPANVPVGDYTVTAYLFRDSALLATETIAVRVSKEGFEQFTFNLAHRYGYLYGLICVALAMLTGWLAGVIFRRD